MRRNYKLRDAISSSAHIQMNALNLIQFEFYHIYVNLKSQREKFRK